jgi:hypothetical protein
MRLILGTLETEKVKMHLRNVKFYQHSAFEIRKLDNTEGKLLEMKAPKFITQSFINSVTSFISWDFYGELSLTLITRETPTRLFMWL